jgi:hypothetical protein
MNWKRFQKLRVGIIRAGARPWRSEIGQSINLNTIYKVASGCSSVSKSVPMTKRRRPVVCPSFLRNQFRYCLESNVFLIWRKTIWALPRRLRSVRSHKISSVCRISHPEGSTPIASGRREDCVKCCKAWHTFCIQHITIQAVTVGYAACNRAFC